MGGCGDRRGRWGGREAGIEQQMVMDGDGV